MVPFCFAFFLVYITDLSKNDVLDFSTDEAKKYIYIWNISVSFVKDVCVGRYIYYAEQ